MRSCGTPSSGVEESHSSSGVVGKRPLGRPRRRWLDNIKMDLSEIGLSVVDWIGLAQDRYRWRALVNAGMNLRESTEWLHNLLPL
jgi:hypothetical protein